MNFNKIADMNTMELSCNFVTSSSASISVINAALCGFVLIRTWPPLPQQPMSLGRLRQNSDAAR
jgi:hypothetical protein